MDEMESMGMPGPISEFINRAIGAPGFVSQLGIHDPSGLSRSLPEANPRFAGLNSAIGDGGSFQVESPPSISPQEGVNEGDISAGEPVKRTRGRPRKYGPERSMPLALSPKPNPRFAGQNSAIGEGGSLEVESSPSISPQGVNEGGISAGMPVKRTRGRPRKYGSEWSMSSMSSPTSDSGAAPSGQSVSVSATRSGQRWRGRSTGTGRKRQLASLGESVTSSAGMAFTPHAITIPVGEDITSRIMSFSLVGPRAVYILSAYGAVSTVTLRQTATSGGDVTYEDYFEILCMSGSYWPADKGGLRSQIVGLSISLSCPDGRVIGGDVSGSLIAASPVQVIVGSFTKSGKKSKSKSKSKRKKYQDSEESDRGTGD